MCLDVVGLKSFHFFYFFNLLTFYYLSLKYYNIE